MGMDDDVCALITLSAITAATPRNVLRFTLVIVSSVSRPYRSLKNPGNLPLWEPRIGLLMDNFRSRRRSKRKERGGQRLIMLDMSEGELHGAVVRIEDYETANVEPG